MTKTLLIAIISFILGVVLSSVYSKLNANNKLTQTQKLYAIDEKIITACQKDTLDLLWCYGTQCGTVNLVKTWGKYDDLRKSLEEQKQIIN